MTTNRMVSTAVVLAIVTAIAVIVLLYMWPEIFGRTHTEYFTDAPPTPPAAEPATNTLPISSMASANLLKAVAVPEIKSLEGFQSGSVHTSLDDGNGHPNSYAGSFLIVGGGYNIQPMDNSPMSGTAAGAGAPSMLTTYTPPLANVTNPTGPLAGAGAGAGPVVLGGVVPIIGTTSVTSVSPIVNGPPIPPTPPAPTMNQQVLNTGLIHIGDVSTGSYATEDQTSTPSFTVAASQVDQNALNIIKTNLASGGQYTLNVTCDLSGVKSSFPLQLITNVTNAQNQIYAYSFQNKSIVKPGPVFFGAKSLNFQIVQTAPLPQNAPNAPSNTNTTLFTNPTPSPSGTSVNSNSHGASGAVVNPPPAPQQPVSSMLQTVPPANQVTSLMMNTLATTLINNLIKNETDPAIKMGLTTALTNVPTNGTNVPNPLYLSVYNAVAAIPANFTYTQLANMYNTLPSSTGSTKPIANPTNVLSMAPLVGFSLQMTNGQVNTAQGPMMSRWQTQPAQQQVQQTVTPPAQSSGLWAPDGVRTPTPPNPISSEPPSTMASILPATAQVSPTNAYTFTNQSIMLDASTLAQKIRSAELMIKCNNM